MYRCFAAMVADMELFCGGGCLILFVGLYVLLVLLWIILVVVGLGRSKENLGKCCRIFFRLFASLQDSKARRLSNCVTIVACYKLIA